MTGKIARKSRLKILKNAKNQKTKYLNPSNKTLLIFETRDGIQTRFAQFTDQKKIAKKVTKN